MLESEGLVESVPKRGAVGALVRRSDDLDDMYQLRALLEGYAARRAATRISPADVARLERELRPLRPACVPRTTCSTSSRRTSSSTTSILEAAAERPARGMVAQGDRDPARLQVVLLVLAGAEAHLASTTTGSSRARCGAGDADRAELIMKEHVLEARDFLLAQLRVGGGRAARRTRAARAAAAAAASPRGRGRPGPARRHPRRRARDAPRGAVHRPPARRHGRRDHQGRAAGQARSAARVGARRATRAARSGGRCSRATRSA